MNRSTRTLVVVGVAVILAALASYSVYRAIKNLPEKQVPIAERFTVVAAQSIPVGMLLTKDLVKVIPWPASSPVLGGFASTDDVIGRGVTSLLVQNEPVVETKLAPRAAGGGLPPLITPGMRAMTVRVNDVIGVAGFTQQGTRVDVVVVLRGVSGADAASRTVLSNVQVLSSNRRIDQEQARAGTGADQSVVTLLVSPEDGEKLALATTQGQIVLALRNPLDTAATDTRGVRMSGLMSGGEPPPAPRTSRPRAAAPPPPAPPPGPKTVQAIRGSKVTQEIIKCCQ